MLRVEDSEDSRDCPPCSPHTCPSCPVLSLGSPRFWSDVIGSSIDSGARDFYGAVSLFKVQWG
jgi:hypothetical protein